MERARYTVNRSCYPGPRVGAVGARDLQGLKLSLVCVWEGVIDWKLARGCLWREREVVGKGTE